MFWGDLKRNKAPAGSEDVQDFFENCVLKRADSRVNLYVYLLLKTWNVCNFRSVWPNYFKFELYKVMDQNFEKKYFFEFFTPQGGPLGGSEQKFSKWLIFVPKFVSDDSKQLLKKKWKKIFFTFFGSPRDPLRVNFLKNFLRGGQEKIQNRF